MSQNICFSTHPKASRNCLIHQVCQRDRLYFYHQDGWRKQTNHKNKPNRQKFAVSPSMRAVLAIKRVEYRGNLQSELWNDVSRPKPNGLETS